MPLTDILTELQALLEQHQRMLTEINKLRQRVATLETQTGDDGSTDGPAHIDAYRALEWDAPAQEQGSYTGQQYQRPDGSLGAELVYDVRDDHFELYTSKNQNGHRVKRWSIASDRPGTFVNWDTDAGHTEYRRVKNDGQYIWWLLDNVNYSGHAVLREEYDPSTGEYRKWAGKTGETLLEANLLPEEDRP